MKRRKTNLFIAVLALFTFFSSCTNEEEATLNTATGICLNIKSGANTRSSVVPGTDPENEIKNLSIWLFSDENDNDATKKLFKKLSTTSSGEIFISEDELKACGMSSAGTYYVYAIANMPSGTLYDESTTLQKLKAGRLEADLRPGESGEGFCMSGYTKVANDFGQHKAVDIYLSRLVSRLDITIKNETGDAWTVNKILVKDDQKDVLLFASDGVQEPVLFDSPQNIVLTTPSNNEQSYTAYVYENMSTTPMKIRVESTIGTEKFNWEVPIEIDGNAKLERNTVCKATLKLKYTDVAIKCEVASTGNWDENIIEGSIDNVNLQFDKDQVILSEYGEARLNVTTNAKKITIDASKAKEIISSGEVAVENGLCELSLVTSNLMKEEYHGELKITAGTVSKTIQVYKPASSHWFIFTEDPKYPDGYNFTWEFTYDPVTKKGAPFHFTFDANIMIWLRYELYEEHSDSYHLMSYTGEFGEDWALTLPSVTTSYEYDIYKRIGKNESGYKRKLVIYVGYLDSFYGPIARTFTYIIDKKPV